VNTQNKGYNDTDIVVLSDRDHVRLRPNIMLGSTLPIQVNVPFIEESGFVVDQIEFIPALYKAVGEILDNSMDEFTKINRVSNTLIVYAAPDAGVYSVSDNGRGIPLGINEQTGLPTPQVTLSMLRAGRNFVDAEKEQGVMGANGVGAAITNMCSVWFQVDIRRDKQQYVQEFTDGALSASTPEIVAYEGTDTGTSISFELDPAVFGSIQLPPRLFKQKMKELALCNKTLIVEYNDEQFKYPNGFSDLFEADNVFKFSDATVDIFIVPVLSGQGGNVYTWVNSSYLFDGGLINTQLTNAFVDTLHTNLQNLAKKNKVELNRNDMKNYFNFYVNAKIQAPVYDTQSKTRMVGPDMRRDLLKVFVDNWKVFAKQRAEWISSVFESLAEQYRLANQRKAIKDHKKNINTKKIPNLRDAVSNDRHKCRLYIVEGLSAASNLTEVRDPMTMGSYPLGGKINVTWNNNVAEVLKMEKISGLLSAIGLIPGNTFNPVDLRYGKLIISTDSDPDGSDIFATVVALLYKFWPDLFNEDHPYVYRLLAPNVCVVHSKTKKRVYFKDLESFREVSHKYSSNYDIMYYKGLGSMELEDWEMLISSDDYLLPIVDTDGSYEIVCDLLFNDTNADNRKIWLTEDY
jgi:DNA gyrase subunit B